MTGPKAEMGLCYAPFAAGIPGLQCGKTGRKLELNTRNEPRKMALSFNNLQRPTAIYFCPFAKPC